jgi:hypothetical protein
MRSPVEPVCALCSTPIRSGSGVFSQHGDLFHLDTRTTLTPRSRWSVWRKSWCNWPRGSKCIWTVPPHRLGGDSGPGSSRVVVGRPTCLEDRRAPYRLSSFTDSRVTHSHARTAGGNRRRSAGGPELGDVPEADLSPLGTRRQVGVVVVRAPAAASRVERLTIESRVGVSSTSQITWTA